MPTPEGSEINWTAVGVIAGAIINIAGWFIVNELAKRRETRRDSANRQQVEQDAAKTKLRDASHALHSAIVPVIDEIKTGTGNLSNIRKSTYSELTKAVNSFRHLLSREHLVGFEGAWKQYQGIKDHDLKGVETQPKASGIVMDYTDAKRVMTAPLEEMLKIADNAAKY